MNQKYRVLMLNDGQGWVVDRIVNEMVKHMKDEFDFTVRSYTKLPSWEFINLVNSHDLTYYSNWDLSYHLNVIDQIKKPFLFSIRSHRYPSYVPDMANRFPHHVISPLLLEKFPKATYIPDGIFDEFKPDHDFTVGMAFQEQSREYKGYYLVKEACDELGCKLKVATNLNPESMRSFYESVNLMVVGSEAEGHNTIAMECAMMNKPVITTNTGVPYLLNMHKCERNVRGFRDAIQRFYTYPQVENYTWDKICNKFVDLFERLI